MLEQLDRIPWSLLQQAHGPATHVPHAIRALGAPDEAIRRRAYWQLDNHVVLQGDLYEAAVYVPPFLLELLRDETLGSIDCILDLLYEIGNGAASPTQRLRVQMTHEGVVPYHESAAPNLQDACRAAVRAGLPVYLAMVETQPPSTRAKIIELVESLDESTTSEISR